MRQEFDYVIIGSGSAGSVLAERLSADPAVSVCVLEAGPRDWSPFIHIPAGFIKTFQNPRLNWCYTQEPGPNTNGRRLLAPRGKVVGGSSSINGHIYNRGQATDYDTWAQLGNHGWSYADVLPSFKKLERRIGAGDPEYRGREGALTVTDLDDRHPLCEAFIKGCNEFGIPSNADYNGASHLGISYAQRTIRKGCRVSAATAFLNPALRRANIELCTNAHVTRLIVAGKRVTGVEYLAGGRRGAVQRISARCEVILSAGAYNSPQILELSGIGRPDVLQAQGIEVRHALSGVGEALQDHFAPRTVVRVKNIHTINELSRGASLGIEILKWITARRGILALSPTLVYCSWTSGVTSEEGDIQFTFTPASYDDGVIGRLAPTPGITVAVWQQRPESRGHVHIDSKDPFAAPRIQHNYLASTLDQRVVVAGMRMARELLQSEPLRPYYDFEEFPGAGVESDADFLAAARAKGNSTFHPAGSCAMGPDPACGAVVNPKLQVHGLQGLRIVDASVVPRMISGNLNAVATMIGDRAADFILAEKRHAA